MLQHRVMCPHQDVSASIVSLSVPESLPVSSAEITKEDWSWRLHNCYHWWHDQSKWKRDEEVLDNEGKINVKCFCRIQNFWWLDLHFRRALTIFESYHSRTQNWENRWKCQKPGWRSLRATSKEVWWMTRKCKVSHFRTGRSWICRWQVSLAFWKNKMKKEVVHWNSDSGAVFFKLILFPCFAGLHQADPRTGRKTIEQNGLHNGICFTERQNQSQLPCTFSLGCTLL